MADLRDRLQEDKLRGLRELLELINDWRAATLTGDGDDELAAIADYLVHEGIGVRQSLRGLWDYYWARAVADRTPGRNRHVAKLWSLLMRGSSELLAAAALARQLADLSRREVARLSDFESKVKAFPSWVQECMARWEMLDSPHKPLDHERAARSRAAFNRGECQDAGEILDRLRRENPHDEE